MEALKLVMSWLDAKELAILARTCETMSKAVRCLTESRAGDAAQGMETVAVPVVNNVDNCRYPYFYYTPFCQFSSSSRSTGRKPWGLRESQRRIVTETEFGGAMTSAGMFMLADAGCKCRHLCTSSEGRPCNIDDGASFDELPASLLKNIHHKKRERPEHTGDGNNSRRLSVKRLTVISATACCGCGRLVGGQPGYDQFHRLQLLTGDSCVHQKVPVLAAASVEEDFHKCVQKELHGDQLSDDCEIQEQVDGPPSLIECGPACTCSSECEFRVSQHGATLGLKVVRSRNKGWSLCSSQQIPQGMFVCEYGGELITNREARKRHMEYDKLGKSLDWQGSALLVLREHLPSGHAALRVNVDATRIGNVARFINHSCDGGNLVPCLIRPAGCIIPKLALFARRYIDAEEELTYSYGTAGEAVDNWKPCFCATSACLGVLPSEST